MPGNDRTTSFAKGTLYLIFGQLVFLVVGYAINVLLALKLGPERYGIFSFVMAILVWIELFVINGIPTAMQRFLPSEKYDTFQLIKLGIKSQFVYCLIVWVIFVSAAPLLTILFADNQLTNLLWIASIDIIIYGMLWLNTGILSGERRFFDQSISVAFYSLSKFVAVFIFISMNMGIKGALIGNWIGSLVGFLISLLFLIHRLKIKVTLTLKFSQISQFVTLIVIYTILINLLLYLDLFFVKRFLTDADVGYYNAASTIARIPYFIFLALSFTLLPVLSKDISEGKFEETRKKLNQVFKFLFILLVPLIFFIWQNAQPIIRILYTSNYILSASILPVLTLSLSLFTIFSIFTTILNSDDKEKVSFICSAAIVIIDVIANLIFIPQFGAVGAAMATGVASLSGVIIGGFFVMQRFKIFFSLSSLIKIVLSASLIILIISPWQVYSVGVVPKAVIFAVVYSFVLLSFKDFRTEIFGLMSDIFGMASVRS